MDEKPTDQQILHQLENTKGEHTSLITLLIPATHNLLLTVNKLNGEYSDSSNIKSRTNRQSVQTALKSLIYHVKQTKTVPANGIAFFSGNECCL